MDTTETVTVTKKIRQLTLLVTGLINVVAGIFVSLGMADQRDDDDHHLKVKVYNERSHWNSTGYFEKMKKDDPEWLSLTSLLGAAIILSGIVRLLGGVTAWVPNEHQWAKMFKNDDSRIYMSRWIEASISLPMVLVALYAILGERDNSHHFMLGVLVVAFSAFGLLNECAVENLDSGKVMIGASEQMESQSTALVGVNVSRSGMRQRRKNESIGPRAASDPTFVQGESLKNPMYWVPYLLQVVILISLTFHFAQVAHKIFDDKTEEDAFTALNTMVISTLVILWVWGLVQLVNVGWAKEVWEHLVCDLLVSVAVFVHFWIVVGVVISTEWMGEGIKYSE